MASTGEVDQGIAAAGTPAVGLLLTGCPDTDCRIVQGCFRLEGTGTMAALAYAAICMPAALKADSGRAFKAALKPAAI